MKEESKMIGLWVKWQCPNKVTYSGKGEIMDKNLGKELHYYIIRDGNKVISIPCHWVFEILNNK